METQKDFGHQDVPALFSPPTPRLDDPVPVVNSSCAPYAIASVAWSLWFRNNTMSVGLGKQVRFRQPCAIDSAVDGEFG